MVGGTHAAHAEVEIWLGKPSTYFTATSKPFTADDIDALTIAAEALITTELEPGNSLPTTKSTDWGTLVCMIVVNLMKNSETWERGRGATSESSEGDGSVTYPSYGADPITPSIRARIKRLESGLGTEQDVRIGDLL
jgi:hypothetical protein